MKDVGGVNVFKTAEDLIDEWLIVRIRKRLAGADDCVKIGFEEFDVQIDRVEIVPINNIHIIQTNDLPLKGDEETDYIFMAAKVLKKFNFTKSTLRQNTLRKDVGDLKVN
jgi:hypothetical protein